MLRTYYVIKSVHKHHLPYDLFDYLYILRNLWPLFSWKKMPQSRDFDCKHHPIIKKTNPTSSWRPLTLFNASLKKAADDNTVSFNPTGWCTDMVGANMNVLRKVFGEGALSRTKSCEFHFKESIQGPLSECV